MQIVINSTDTVEALIVARNTINDLLARRDHPQTLTAGTANTSINALQAIASQHPEVVQQPPPAPEPAPKKAAKPKVVKTASAEEVRMLMVAKSAEGKRDDVITVLHGFGAKKLSEVDPEKLPDLKTKLEAL